VGRSPLAPISHDLDLFALSMTWLLVTRYPSAEMKKPEPAAWRMRGRRRGAAVADTYAAVEGGSQQ
jgi:hypothetical protein